MKRAYTTALAALLVFCSVLALFALLPASAANPAPLAAPTPVAAVVRSTAPEFPVFFRADTVLTADTRSSCFESPEFSVVDLQYLIDQGTTNTTTLTLQFSNDLVTFVDGLAAVTDNAADASGLMQMQLFGRHACIYANVANTSPVTITVNGVFK